jgi:beta-lactamase superfamily II metal-dependent hydrolase
MPEKFAVNTVAYIGVGSVNAEVLFQEAPAKGRRKRRAWTKAAMLWGDPVFIRKIDGGQAEVSAKGHRLRLGLNKLTNKGILSLWQVDCGQGDAALLRFPDGTFAAIDMGPPRRGLINSNSARIALDFFKWVAFDDNNWRFEGDRAGDPFHFEWLVLTHPDEDHAGGAKEFVAKLGELWSVGKLFHCGLGRFKGEDSRPQVPAGEDRPEQPGFGQLGPVKAGEGGELYLSQLIDGAGDIEKFSEPAGRRAWFLSGNYANVLKAAADHVGGAVGKIKRLSHKSSGASLGRAGVKVKVLGPVEEQVGGKAALRYLDNNSTTGRYNLAGPSLSRNGHSVVLRLDYGECRLLMTGDLNFRSHALLLQQWPAEEFACHVGKACHHGSEDISWSFLRAMDPLAVMFSSGDQETHVHPRALALGLSGAFSRRARRRTSPEGAAQPTFEETSFAGFEEPKLFSPLLYSTELSRSARLRTDMKAYKRGQGAGGNAEFKELGAVYFKGPSDKDDYVAQRDTWIVDRLTYGLINVRTDGKTVRIAVLEEGDEPEYHIETFRPSELVPI